MVGGRFVSYLRVRGFGGEAAQRDSIMLKTCQAGALLQTPHRGIDLRFKASAIALTGLAVLVAPVLLSVSASAQTGTSSSYGSYGSGQQIPTQALTPFDREWNNDHEAQSEARAGAEWIRKHAETGQPYSFRFP
jgi:hypothetical protein